MRLFEITAGSYQLFHGSAYSDIETFRLDNLRHRTGTPGTLSFTTSVDTAKIYGKNVYKAKVSGSFGDYLNPDDVQKNFDFRWPGIKNWHERRNENDILERAKSKTLKDISEGHYAMWENPSLWKHCGWDGAWCFETGSRNLIVGNISCVKMIGRVDDSSNISVLYHGTCEENAKALLANGWQPNKVSSGGNGGQSRYLYLTNVIENALWFANEKGCSSVVAVKKIPVSHLAVDPEDGGDGNIHDELNKSHGLPGYLVLTKPLSAEHFEIIQ